MVPITGNFSSRQLTVRRQASAIYLFEVVLPVFEQFDVAYASSPVQRLEGHPAAD